MRLPRPASSFPRAVLPLLAIALLTAVSTAGVARHDVPAGHDRATVAAALADLGTVPRRVHVLGYSREQFGGGWSQQWWTDGTGAGALCSIRDIVMLESFTEREESGPGADGTECPSPGGATTDVYSGEPMSPSEVEIDHVVPLSAAWDHGAWSWERDLRVAFANDRDLNLLAVTGNVNQAKSDGTLGEWRPPTAKAGSLSEAGCAYAARYLSVCVRYGLTVSEHDAEAGRAMCGL